MKWLLILLSVMIWTVKDKNTVTGEGLWPYDIEVDYHCTYQKGTVRRGDTATLTLSNLGGMAVEKIELSMRSNQSGGAGIITVSSNGSVIKTISGTFKDWIGAYDNENFHPIAVLSDRTSGINSLSVSVAGTTNSLFIEKFTITSPSAPARTVTLMNGPDLYATIEEEYSYAGVYLPSLPDRDYWHFIGWSQFHFYEINTFPELLPANQMFYPTEDVTLWAVYRYREEVEKTYVTDLQSGDYIYANRINDYTMTGVPEDNRMDFTVVDLKDIKQVYHIEFTASADTAYITHLQSQTPIGYSGLNLVVKASPWLVYHEGDETLFYMKYSGKNYVLWPYWWDDHEKIHCTGLQSAGSLASPMGLLLPQLEPEEQVYTCHPEFELDITTPAVETQEVIVPFGIYELHIRDGRKQVRLRN